MRLQERFKNALSYAEAMETWVTNTYKNVCGRDINYDFAFPYDFALCDFIEKKEEAEKTYHNCIRKYSGNYEAMTQLYICLMYVAQAEGLLAEQGFEGREEWGILFQNLASKTCAKFNKSFAGNKEACKYFFQWTLTKVKKT